MVDEAFNDDEIVRIGSGGGVALLQLLEKFNLSFVRARFYL